MDRVLLFELNDLHLLDLINYRWKTKVSLQDSPIARHLDSMADLILYKPVLKEPIMWSPHQNSAGIQWQYCCFIFVRLLLPHQGLWQPDWLPLSRNSWYIHFKGIGLINSGDGSDVHCGYWARIWLYCQCITITCYNS